MGAVRFVRTLMPLAVVAAMTAACGGGGSKSSPDDSTPQGASSGFEVRPVFARYAPGVPFGPEVPQPLVQVMQNQACPMKPLIIDAYLMECDAAKTVYALQNPIATGSVATATAKQIGHKNLWYVEVGLDGTVAQKLTQEIPSMTGEQLAFTYNGAVLTSIAIDKSFHPTHFAITGDYNQSSATKLASELTG
jgi:hypothetical protein